MNGDYEFDPSTVYFSDVYLDELAEGWPEDGDPDSLSPIVRFADYDATHEA